MSEYTPPSYCVICLEPTSMCYCDSEPHTKLALHLVNSFEPETVSVGREAFITLCERAYAWGQHLSARAEVCAVDRIRSGFDAMPSGTAYTKEQIVKIIDVVMAEVAQKAKIVA